MPLVAAFRHDRSRSPLLPSLPGLLRRLIRRRSQEQRLPPDTTGIWPEPRVELDLCRSPVSSSTSASIAPRSEASQPASILLPVDRVVH